MHIYVIGMGLIMIAKTVSTMKEKSFVLVFWVIMGLGGTYAITIVKKNCRQFLAAIKIRG